MKRFLAIFTLCLVSFSQWALGANSYYGIVTCTTAAVAYHVAPLIGYTGIACLQVIVTADPANTGTLYLGMSNAVSSSNYFAALQVNGSFNSGPSGSVPSFPCQDLWVTGSVNSTLADILILPGVISQ
jgi:hypothetical protein